MLTLPQRLLILGLVFLIPRETQADVSWATVPLGGGGYVTGLVSSSDGGTIYCRTDVGGAFRWVWAADGINGSWVSISDSMVPYGTAGASGLMNVEGIGTDPSNANQVYVGAGSDYSTGLRGIWSSPNQGVSWTQINSAIRMNANGSAKGTGERLAVDPNNANIVWYGSNQDGLQKGVNSGGIWTWTQIPGTSVPFGLAGLGVTFVACDKNGTSTILYAGVHDASVGGIYKSTDGGMTWANVSGTQMLSPSRAQVAKGGTLYVTDGGATIGKLTRAGVFTLLSTLPAGNAYNAVAVDPNDAADNTVYVAQSSGGGIWISTNGGTSRLGQGTTFNEGPVNLFNHQRKEPDGTLSLTGYWFGDTSSMLITPGNSNQLWLGDFFGVSRTSNATAMGTNPGCWWYTLQKNQEETVVLDLKVPPSGPALMSGLADIGGFHYNNITVRPYGTGGNGFGGPGGGNDTSLDFSEANTNVWARGWVNSSGSTGSAAASSDGGVTWLEAGEVAQSTVTNSATAAWVTWDITTFLAQQKALGVNTVTLAVASNNCLDYSSTSVLGFDSREATDTTLTPRLVINGGTNLIATADAYVNAAATTTNYGSSTQLQCKYYFGGTSSRYIYLRFDLTSVTTITSATLNLHRQAATNTSPFPVGIYYCNNTSWVEGTMTWNTKPPCTSNPGGGPQEGPNYYNGSTALSGGRMAVSSTNPNNIVWMPINAPPQYSNDRGVTWTASTGAPASQISGIYTTGSNVGISAQPLAADRGNGDFYIGAFGGTAHTIYRSTNGGATWASVGTVSNGGSYNARTPQLVAAPVSSAYPAGGDVWLCDDGTYNNQGGGLWRSINAGVNWASISAVTKVSAVSFGKGPSAGSYSVYISGYKAGVFGVYRSDDYGTNWTLLTNPTLESISAIAGDRQNYGQVFIGTGGRGVFLTTQAPLFTNFPMPTPTSATVGTAFNFTFTASGFPAPTFSVGSGSLPPGLSITSSGTLSGVPTQAGTYSGTILATNGFGAKVTQSFTFQITAVAAGTFSSWASAYFTAQQLSDPNVGGPNSTPQGDGISNFYKFLYDINPTRPMTAADQAALSTVSMTSNAGQKYLCLTYRQNALLSGVTINLQSSPDLQTWTTVTPDISQQIGTDAGTNDPILELGVNVTGLSHEFLKLKVTSP